MKKGIVKNKILGSQSSNQNTVKMHRKSWIESFYSMQRFDRDPSELGSTWVTQQSVDKWVDFVNTTTSLLRKSSSKRHRSLSVKKKSLSPTRRTPFPQTVIEPYKSVDCPQNFDLRQYESEKGKVSVSKLRKLGLWKKIPDLVRNELWIRERKRNISKKRKMSKNKLKKECTFKPKLNKTVNLSPSPHYKYYGHKSSVIESYSKERERKQEQKHIDMHELYGKYVQHIGKS